MNNYSIHSNHREFDYGDIITTRCSVGYYKLLLCKQRCECTNKEYTVFFDIGKGDIYTVSNVYQYKIGNPGDAQRQRFVNKYNDEYMEVFKRKDRIIKKRKLKSLNSSNRDISKIGHKSIIKTKDDIYMILKYEYKIGYMILDMKRYIVYRNRDVESVEDIYKSYTGKDLRNNLLGYINQNEYDLYRLDKLGRYVLCNIAICDTDVCYG